MSVEACFAASTKVSSTKLLSAFGEAAELIIDAHYCKAKGGCQRLDPGGRTTVGPQTDFFDTRMGPSRCRHLAEYRALHYPVDAVRVSGDCEATKADAGRFAVPDIITYVPDGRH